MCLTCYLCHIFEDHVPDWHMFTLNFKYVRVFLVARIGGNCFLKTWVQKAYGEFGSRVFLKGEIGGAGKTVCVPALSISPVRKLLCQIPKLFFVLGEMREWLAGYAEQKCFLSSRHTFWKICRWCYCISVYRNETVQLCSAILLEEVIKYNSCFSCYFNQKLLFERGKESLESEFRSLMTRHSKPVPPILIFDLISLEDEVEAQEDVTLEHLPESVLQDIIRISGWLVEYGRNQGKLIQGFVVSFYLCNESGMGNIWHEWNIEFFSLACVSLSDSWMILFAYSASWPQLKQGVIQMLQYG